MVTAGPRQSSATHYTLAEYASVEVDVDASTAAAMHADGHVSVSPLAPGGRYEVRAKHKVGVLRYGDIELRIVPKVPIARLLYLAAFRDNQRGWREVETLLAEAADPLSAIAHALAFHAERALRPTPLQGYVTHESSERRLRGRMLFDAQIARRAGVLVPMELRYDEYELDIIENRVLRAAIELVAPHSDDAAVRQRLAHLRFRLADVESWPTGLRIPEITFGRINERYRSALALARLVLERRTLEFPERDKVGSAFLFNMNHVFESYLEAELRRELESRGGSVRGQNPTYLDHASAVLMKPDVTWWDGGVCRAVIDAKYKRSTSVDYPNADAYQMLAYCVRLGLTRGYLVYADLDDDEAGSTVIRNLGTEIVVTSINIGGTIAELQTSIADLAGMIASSAPAA